MSNRLLAPTASVAASLIPRYRRGRPAPRESDRPGPAVLRSQTRNRVLIGKDTRIFPGYMLETAMTGGLVSMGMDVFMVGPMPTPGVAHLTKSMGAAAGIMLTASHNPYEDNGIKIFGSDGYKDLR
ncbi:MAG: hypothetical protein QM755_22475 [Luteolibacter sp.]